MAHSSSFFEVWTKLTKKLIFFHSTTIFYFFLVKRFFYLTKNHPVLMAVINCDSFPATRTFVSLNHIKHYMTYHIHVYMYQNQHTSIVITQQNSIVTYIYI